MEFQGKLYIKVDLTIAGKPNTSPSGIQLLYRDFAEMRLFFSKIVDVIKTSFVRREENGEIPDQTLTTTTKKGPFVMILELDVEATKLSQQSCSCRGI